ATLAAARQAFPGRRLVAVFQPHLYSRTALHGESLGKALAAADMVVVAPIYGAREEPLAGVTHHLVVRGATRAGAATVGVRDRAATWRSAGCGRSSSSASAIWMRTRFWRRCSCHRERACLTIQKFWSIDCARSMGSPMSR